MQKVATLDDNNPVLQFLKRQFQTTHELTEWFVCFRSAVKNLSDEQAKQRVHSALPSIFEIVTHLTYWNERHLRRIMKQPFDTALSDNDETFTRTPLTDWLPLYAKADSVFGEWLTAFATPGLFTEPDLAILGNIITHNAYHIGQIITIRKLQGSWNSEEGVS
jgi:uncharacterized damage-inducible protein DinB